MGLFNRRPEQEPRFRSLAEMIAYSLTNEVTRDGWKSSSRDGLLSNKGLRVAIDLKYPRGSSFWSVKIRGAVVPFNRKDEATIEVAVGKWRMWDDERKRTGALLDFVDAFESAVAAQVVETEGAGGHG